MNTEYNTISSKYKFKFYNMILKDYLNKFGGYDIEHDDMVYRLSNFGAKVRPTYINFSFGTRDQQDAFLLIELLESYNIFDIKQHEPNIVQISFMFTPEKINQLKYKHSKTQFEKKMKQLVINCYRKIKDTSYDSEQNPPE